MKVGTGSIALAVLITTAVASAPVWHAQAQQAREPEAAATRVTPIVQVVRKVGPTVVNLYADLEIQGGFFGTQEVGSLGSGVLVHPAGLIVTNAHVITGNSRASRLKDVTVSYRPDWSTSQGEMQKFTARVLGFNPSNDLALLQIQAKGPFPYAKLGTSSDLMIGETVVALGNPLGREGSVTHGIVSATNRSLESPTGDEFDDLIQTDAPLNSGNSGGPLFNILGELIGINQAIAGDRQFGRAEGQGLALPVDRVRDLLATEFNPFYLLHVWLGLEVDQGDGGGAVAKRVERDSPANRAGLQSGDRIVRVASYDVTDRTAFNLSICTLDNNDAIPLTFVRDGKRRETTLEPVQIDAVVRSRLGAMITPRAGYLLFTDVDQRGAAAAVGIMEGDALIELGGTTVKSIQDVFSQLRDVDVGDESKIVVYRFTRGRPMRTLKGAIKV